MWTASPFPERWGGMGVTGVPFWAFSKKKSLSLLVMLDVLIDFISRVQTRDAVFLGRHAKETLFSIGGFHVTQVSLIITRVKNKIAYHLINWVKNIVEEWLINNVSRFRGCAIFRTRVIRQKVSLKIIVFSMETPCWSPSEGLQHKSNMAAGHQWKHLEFSLPLSKRSFSLIKVKTFA